MSYLERVKKSLPRSVSKVSKGAFEPFETHPGRLISENYPIWSLCSDACRRVIDASVAGKITEEQLKSLYREIEEAFERRDSATLGRFANWQKQEGYNTLQAERE